MSYSYLRNPRGENKAQLYFCFYILLQVVEVSPFATWLNENITRLNTKTTQYIRGKLTRRLQGPPAAPHLPPICWARLFLRNQIKYWKICQTKSRAVTAIPQMSNLQRLLTVQSDPRLTQFFRDSPLPSQRGTQRVSVTRRNNGFTPGKGKGSLDFVPCAPSPSDGLGHCSEQGPRAHS